MFLLKVECQRRHFKEVDKELSEFELEFEQIFLHPKTLRRLFFLFATVAAR